MNRAELEHIIRAASGITSQPDLVVVGSQAVLAQFPDAPEALLSSMEADIYPRHRPDLSIQIDGAIGERSLFHETFGYYAHGVDDTTAILPPGWQQRLVPIHNENTGGATGWCLEVHDLAASKLVAGREGTLPAPWSPEVAGSTRRTHWNLLAPCWHVASFWGRNP